MGGGALVNNGDTADWKADHVSTANNSTQDHASHAHSLESVVAPSHDADTRNNAKLVADLQKHDRHPKLVTGSECTSIACAHVQRTYYGKATSSIVVNHICQNPDSTDGTNATNDAWGAQFVSANTNPDCTEETVCTEGHVCGMTNSGVCECHAWSFTTENTDWYDTQPVAHHTATTYLPVPDTEVDGEPSEYFTTPAP